MRTQTDMLVKGGYKAVGYQYVHISDCWAAMKRDSQGHLVADPKRFPSGIKALADYVSNLSKSLYILFRFEY